MGLRREDSSTEEFQEFMNDLIKTTGPVRVHWHRNFLPNVQYSEEEWDSLGYELIVDNNKSIQEIIEGLRKVDWIEDNFITFQKFMSVYLEGNYHHRSLGRLFDEWAREGKWRESKPSKVKYTMLVPFEKQNEFLEFCKLNKISIDN